MSLVGWTLVIRSLVWLVLGVVVVILAIAGVVELIRSALSDLATRGNKGIFTAGDFLEDRVTQVLHEHLFPALHICNSDILNELIGMIC